MFTDGLKLISTTSILEDTRIESGSTFPATYRDQELFYLTDDVDATTQRGMYIYDNAKWESIVTIPDTSVKSGSTFPATNPDINHLFYLTADLSETIKSGLYIMTATGWVSAVAVPDTSVKSGSSFPSSPVDGQMFYLSATSGNNQKGLYRYKLSTTTWEYATSSSYVAENIANKDQANGYAGLDANSKIALSQLPSALEQQSNKGVANGYAGLDSTGKVPSAQLPAIAITNTFVVNTQTAMLALTAETGDVAVRTDLSKSFILTASPSSTLGNWQELLTPPDAVTSVNGMTGAVTVVKTVNGQNGDVVIQTDSGSTFPVSPTNKQLFYLTADSGNFHKGLFYYATDTWVPAYYDTSTPYDIAGYTPGLPLANSKMFIFIVPTTRPFKIPANLAGSLSKSEIAATNNVIYSIRKNNTEVATITFAAGSKTGTFSQQAEISFSGGDILSLVAPSTMDGSHADIMWTIVANLV